MGWTKRQFVLQAFDELGYADYDFDLEPEKTQSMLRRLDSMMAGWNAVGIRVGWPLPGSPGSSDLEVETGVPDSANEAIYLGLAVRAAPSLGKVISPDTKAQAREAYGRLANQAAMPTPERRMPRDLPRGAGQKPWRDDRPFFDAAAEPLSPSDGDAAFDFE